MQMCKEAYLKVCLFAFMEKDNEKETDYGIKKNVYRWQLGRRKHKKNYTNF